MVQLTIYNYTLCDVPLVFTDKPSEQIITKAGEYQTIDKDTTVGYYIPLQMNSSCQTTLASSGSVWSDSVPIGSNTSIVIGMNGGDGSIYGKTDTGCVNLSATTLPTANSILTNIVYTGSMPKTCSDSVTDFTYPDADGSGDIYISNNWAWIIVVILIVLFIIIVVIVIGVYVYKRYKKTSSE